MVVGNTELGVEVKFKHCDYPVYICPNGVKEMSEIKVTQAGVRFDKVVFQINSNYIFPSHSSGLVQVRPCPLWKPSAIV